YSFAVALWGFGKPFQDGEDAWGTHWRLDATVRRQGKKCCGKNNLDRANWRKRAEVRHLLGAVMKAKKARNKRPSVLDVVALLTDLPAQRLARGRICSSCTTSRKPPDRRTAGQNRSLQRSTAWSGVDL